MKISVIIPTYKPGKYIFECLESLRTQTLDKSQFEIILVLNGCNEPYLSTLQVYIDTALSGLNVNLVHTDKVGVSIARNIALDCAAGEYIAFVDDDDWVSPAYLEELLRNSTPNSITLSDSLYFDDATGIITAENAHHRRFLYLRNLSNPTLFQSRVFFNGPCMKLIHSNIIDNRRFDISFSNGEDNLMMFQISDRVRGVRYTSSDAIYYRRIRENSATTRHRSRTRVSINSLKIMVKYIKYLAKNPFGYNYPFVLSRFAAEVKSIIIR